MSPRNDCYTYLSHLRSEHHRLELLSGSVADRFEQSRQSSWDLLDRPEIAAKLGALRNELAKHVDVEQRGGCIDEAVARMPSLSDAARRIYREGDELKETLQRVMQLVESGPRHDAERAFQKFASDLRRHEHEEEQLVAKGMNVYPFDD